MKRKITAFILAAAVAAICVPAMSGCSAQTDYILKTDENGNKYYAVSCAGVGSNLGGEIVIDSYHGEGDDYAPVTEISEQGFSSTGAKKITVPATVTRIGVAAFAYNNALESVVFEEGSTLSEISRGTFGYCPSLKEVALPQSVRTVGAMSFYNCTGLVNIVMPAVESIGEQAFEYCSLLKSVTLPQTLSKIGERAFYFAGITRAVIPDAVTEIGYAAFHSCTSLEAVTVGAGVTVIKSGVFGYCTSLKTVTLPASLERIEGARYDGEEFYCGHAFHSDAALTDVYFGGTGAQWEALKNSIDNKPVTEQNTTFDNGALFGATLHTVEEVAD